MVKNISADPQGEHRHLEGWPVIIAVEVGGGNNWHPPEVKCPPPRRPTWFMCR